MGRNFDDYLTWVPAKNHSPQTFQPAVYVLIQNHFNDLKRFQFHRRGFTAWPRNYVLMQAMINLAPLILATLAYLVQKRKYLSQLAQPAQNTEIAQNSIVTKGEFLWQIPIVFEVRNFMLWKRLKDAIKENQKRMCCESRDALMIVVSQIETLRMYQTFGTSIPSFILGVIQQLRGQNFAIF